MHEFVIQTQIELEYSVPALVRTAGSGVMMCLIHVYECVTHTDSCV